MSYFQFDEDELDTPKSAKKTETDDESDIEDGEDIKKEKRVTSKPRTDIQKKSRESKENIEKILREMFNREMVSMREEIDRLKSEIKKSEQHSVQFMLFDTDAIKHYIRQKFPQFDGYTDDQLSTEKRLHHLPGWSELPYNDRELLRELVRTVRDRGALDRHNWVQNRLNEEKNHSQKNEK